MPDGAMTERTEAAQDVMSVDAAVHVMVMRVAPGGGGYVRLAHWQMGGSATANDEPVLLPDDIAQDVSRARSVIGRLMKHLRGGREE